MNSTDLNTQKKKLMDLRDQVRQLESEILNVEAGQTWQATGFYTAYYATTGFMLGMFGAISSLFVNVICSPIVGKHPLEIIRIYLTFPFGKNALALTTAAENMYAIDDGMILALGCCLYIGMGMLLGVPFHVVLTRIAPHASLPVRLIYGAVVATALWLIGFYGILTWLQPALFGGDWITNGELLPWWVAMATHLVYGLTMALVYPLGQYIPYATTTDDSSEASD